MTVAFLALLLVGGTVSVTHSAGWCDATGFCRAYISKNPVPVAAQETPVWCWAASLEMLFAYYGHPVSQSTIVTRYFGAAVPVTGNPWVLSDALNNTWVDQNNRQFRVSSRITDRYYGTRSEVNNTDIIAALKSETPVFYADTTHAMILVQADYYPVYGVPYIVGGGAIDPWPATLGFRLLQQNELTALFVGIPTIQELGSVDTLPPNVTITSHSNGQTVTSTSITLSGSATDSGNGNSGIASVTVNGKRANGDTASGTGVASWSLPVTLVSGVNRFEVIATDNSTAHNTRSLTIQINYSTPPAPSMFTKVGISRGGQWSLDRNGNGELDSSEPPIWLGQTGDVFVVGDWNGDGRTKAGIFRPSEGLWVLDYDGNGRWDGPPSDRFFYLGQTGDIPVVGDWNGDGRAKAGIFRPSQGLWVLDYNGNGHWDGPPNDTYFWLGQSGDLPVVGDWNGDGRAKAGIFRPNEGLWVLDYNGNGRWDGPPNDTYFWLGQSDDLPVVGDWNGDKRSKAGIFSPGQGKWMLDYNGSGSWDAADRLFFLGQPGDSPVVGRW
jgi:hypothetical protein